jgi:RNA polymerase sigma-70 factor (ECF subfamily)
MAMTNELFNFAAMAQGNYNETERPISVPQRVISPETSPASSEWTLVQRVMQGDREAYYELVKPNERMIFSAAFSILKNEEDAEDVAQESVMKGLVHLGSFRGDCKFGTWLVQIVINESRMRLRKRNRRYFESIDSPESSEDGERSPLEIADAKPLPSQEVENNELKTRLEKAILELSPIYRDVFILRDVNQLSITETAKALAISEASVKTRLLRARLKLREAFSDYETH